MPKVAAACLALVIGFVIASCVAPEAPNADSQTSGRDCFNVSFLSGYESVDRDTIRVRAAPQQSYEIDVSGAECNQLDWTHRLAIESTPSSWICVGNAPGQGNIYFRDPATRHRVACYIQDVRRVRPTPDAPQGS